jgi:hypothetical protein
LCRGRRVTGVRAATTLLLVALAATALLAGCSDGDNPSSTPEPSASTSTTTKAEPPPDYAKAADSLCSEAMAEQEDLRRELGGRQITLGDRARLLVELAPPRMQLAEDLAALEPPPADAKQAKQLVASAERRGEASALAGELWEEDGSKDEIAEQAAIEHDERELFVEIARDLGLGACAEILSGPERKAASAGALALFSDDPVERCNAVGRRLTNEQYGSTRACRSSDVLLVPFLNEEEEATVDDVDGMDQVFALARVTGPQGSYRVRLTFEDGVYVVDKVD